MIAVDAEILKPLARKYIWWKTPEEAVRTPERVIAQVMDTGDYSDAQKLATEVGDAVLRTVLTHSQAGQFNARSWVYWHYRLGLARTEYEIPPLPTRRFA